MRTLIFISFLAILTASACKQSNEEQESIDSNTSINQTSIAVGIGPDAMFLTPDKKKLYIANVEDSTISIISTVSDQVIKTISGIRYPWGFARLGTSNNVAVSAYDKQIAVIDFSTDNIIREKQYGSHLGGIVADNIGEFLYVVAIDDEKVMKIDAATLDSIDSFDTGNAPDGIGISKDNSKVYVTNTEDGTISIINVVTKSSSIINTGGKPELVHGNFDHSLLYISNFNKNKIHVLNTITDNIVHEITGLNGPEEAVADHSNQKLYVVNFNSAKVFEYDAVSYSKLESEYTTGNKPIGITPVSNKLYVTNYGGNSVSVITK